jgi:putative ABC transport system substrate-binding protein
MKKSRHRAALAALAALALLAGCAGGGADGAAEAPPGAKKVSIAVVLPMEHPSLSFIRDTVTRELEASSASANIEISQRNANGDFSMLPTIMQELVSSGTDIIVAIATPTAQAAKAAMAGTGTKLVFSAVSAPVPAILPSLDDASLNITGVSDSIPVEEIFALAKTLSPGAKSFGFVYNPAETNSVSGIARAKLYCDANQIPYNEATVASTSEVATAAQSLAGKVDALFTPDDNTVASAMAPYAQAALANSMPLYVGADSMVSDGALATVGINYERLGIETAKIAANLANGQGIEENPVLTITDYERIINRKTADALGLSIAAELESEFKFVGE